MSARDENDRLRDGTLPTNPFADAKRTPPLRSVETGKQQTPLPANVVVERALIGAFLWAGKNAPDKLRVTAVGDLIENGGCFFERACGETFDAMVRCAQVKQEHDPVAVLQQLASVGVDKAVGGSEGLGRLLACASTVSERQARVYAQTIRAAWAKRSAITDLRNLIEDARDPKIAAEEIFERARAATNAFAQRTSSAAASVSLRQSAELMFVDIEKGIRSPTYATGIRAVDDMLNGGFRPGETSVVAARTNLGKSLFGSQTSENIVTTDPNLAVLYVTLEMPHRLFTMRLAAARAEVPISNIRRMVLNDEQKSRLSSALIELASRSIYFADSPSQTLASVFATAVERTRALEREGKRLAMVVIDHVGLVKPSAEVLKKGTREQQVAETSRGMRYIATELGCHVMGIAQIGREYERGGGQGMPKLHHLRESGSLETDADVVLILHRQRRDDGQFDANTPPAIALAKGRMDETGVTLVSFSNARWGDWNESGTYLDFYGKS